MRRLDETRLPDDSSAHIAQAALLITLCMTTNAACQVDMTVTWWKFHLYKKGNEELVMLHVPKSMLSSLIKASGLCLSVALSSTENGWRFQFVVLLDFINNKSS